MMLKKIAVALLATLATCAATNTNVKEINSRHQQKHDGCDCKCTEQPQEAPAAPPTSL